MDFWSFVVLLLITMDPVGNVPAIQSLLCKVEPKERMRILMRELLFALGVMMVFVMGGRYLLDFLRIETATLGIAGGVILFLIALGMIFPSISVISSNGRHEEDGEVPFLVPIAVPLIVGPSAIAVILLAMAKMNSLADYLQLSGGVILAWVMVMAILLISQPIMKILGNKGAVAVERLMGILLALIAVQMFINGIHAAYAS